MTASQRFLQDVKAVSLEVVAPRQGAREWMIELCFAAILGFAIAVAL